VAPTGEVAGVPPAPEPEPQAAQPVLFAFSEPVYEGVTGRDFEIRLTAANLDKAARLPLEILFNPQLLTFVKGEAGNITAAKDFSAEADAARGLLRVTVEYPSSAPASGSGVLAKLVLRGERPGISYLVYRAPSVTVAGGETQTAQVRASRVVIK
jgi:hypothetical protein